MKFLLDDYIDEYIKEADDNDKTVAQHLKEIIPQTTHLNQETFKQIFEELKREMDNEENFKNAFRKVCEKYILTGDYIKADLPGILIRVILDESKFLEKIAKKRGVPPNRKEIQETVDSNRKKEIEELLGTSMLSQRKVVFATFDENDMEADPFKNYTLKDIVNMLALDTRIYNAPDPLTVVSIQYRNRDDVIKRFPVFTDAGWYDKFYPSHKNDQYGRTKPLDKSSRGMPEIVHVNLRLADIIEDIRFLEE